MLFIIGNGFDIARGLKTSYKNFLDWYLFQNEDNAPQSVIKLKNAIRRDVEIDIDSWADLEIKLGMYTKEYDDNEVGDFIIAYRNIKNKLDEYIKAEEANVNTTKIVSVSNEFLKFIVGVPGYLPRGYSDSLEDIFNPRDRAVIYNFINFNYTNTLKRCLRENSEVCKRTIAGDVHKDCVGEIVHVHGMVGDYPLLGVDNVRQVIRESFLTNEELKGLLIKPYINDISDKYEVKRAKELIDESELICFYGVSLGDSDISWWVIIGEWLKAQPSRKIVIFKYYEGLLAERWDVTNVIDKTRKHFAAKAGLSDKEYDNQKHKILVYPYKNIVTHKLV